MRLSVNLLAVWLAATTSAAAIAQVASLEVEGSGRFDGVLIPFAVASGSRNVSLSAPDLDADTLSDVALLQGPGNNDDDGHFILLVVNEDETNDLTSTSDGWTEIVIVGEDSKEDVWIGWNGSDKIYQIEVESGEDGTQRPLAIGADGGNFQLFLDTTGNVGIGMAGNPPVPVHPLEMGSGAHVTAAGVWTNASSRVLKENVRALTTEEAVAAFKKLKPVKFNYKLDEVEEYIGFIGEDVPPLVATKDRKGLSPMDLVAVLTKVVQQQQEAISVLEDRIEALEQSAN